MVNGQDLERRTSIVTDVAGDHDLKSQESTGGNFGAPHCSCFFSCFFSYSYSASRYSYSYSIRSSIAIQPIGPQVTANRLDKRSASPQHEQPSSTSTASPSTSTSTTKSDAMHERMLCSCKLRLRRASPTVGLHSGHRSLLGLRRLHAEWR